MRNFNLINNFLHDYVQHYEVDNSGLRDQILSRIGLGVGDCLKFYRGLNVFYFC